MIRLTRHGLWEIVIGCALLAVIAAVAGHLLRGYGWVAALPFVVILPLVVWLFAFFRDPERAVSASQTDVVSPADGTVSDITEIDHHDLIGGPCVRVGIFLSVFNVHVNRAPLDGRVIDVRYKKGRFVNAMNHNTASEQNESNTLVLAEIGGDRPVAVVKQIVGLIARRIVCDAKVGDVVGRGERFGMIKFGSRTELYLPTRLRPTITVSIGQEVRGAADVVATLGEPVPARPA